MMIDPATSYLYGTMLQRRSMFVADAATGSRDGHAPAQRQHSPAAAGDPCAAGLDRILAGSVYPLRYEPDNLVPIHRGVASSSGAFAVDLIISDPARGAAFCVDSPNFCLTPIPWNLPAGPDPQAAPWFYLVARLDRLIARYGDLALGLCAYEAGMLAAQLRILANAEGWGFEYQPLHCDQPLRAATGESAWQWVPLIAGQLTGVAARAVIPAAGTGAPLSYLVHTEANDAARAPLTHALLTQPRVPPVDCADEPVPPPGLQSFDLRQAIVARTSDTPRQYAAVAPQYSMDECDRLFERTSELLAVMRSSRAGQREAGLLVIADGSSGVIGGRVTLPGRHQLTAFGTGPRVSALGLLRAEAGGGLACYIVIDEVSDPITGYASLVDEWLWTGVVTQALCLAGSSMGWFSRPVRNFDDAWANALVEPNERVVMKLELGKLAAPPFGFALGHL